MINLDFYKDKSVFVTGHTGFKGTWLCKILIESGANVTGYALEPPTQENLFEISKIKDKMTHIIGDIRNLETLKRAFDEAEPEIVFHLAAQPIVRTSYELPVYTYETNVIGTVNILECIRNSSTVKSFLNVTTDKVYQNNEWGKGYTEDDILNGFDPYSNSKSCSELVTSSYKKSFFADNHVRISTARAGNVIGGGDFARDRIIPDCIRAAINKEKIIVRNPNSIRPFQHVLEPIFAYLMIAKEQYDEEEYDGCYNIGPNEEDCVTIKRLVDLFCKYWGENLKWENRYIEGPHEANFLKLDCSKIKRTFKWSPKWDIEKAIEKTVEFAKAYRDNENVPEYMNKQIQEYMS